DRRRVPDDERGRCQSVSPQVVMRSLPMRPRILLVIALWLVVGASLSGQPAQPNQATVTYVHSLQQPDGGYAPKAATGGAAAPSTVSATLSAVRALKYFGDKPRNPEAAAKFVASCFN